MGDLPAAPTGVSFGLLVCSPLLLHPCAAHADNGYFATFYSENVPYAQYFDSKRASHALSQDPGEWIWAAAWGDGIGQG